MRKRKSSRIIPQKTFAIVVEGECEVWYFQMLKRNERALKTHIKPEIPQKKVLKNQFEIVRNLSSDYYKVFWVIDLDVIIKESNEKRSGVKTPLAELNEYISQIKSKPEYNNVTVIINTPCLEYWFLLHHIETSRYYNSCSNVMDELKKHLSDYSKTQDYFTKQNNDIYIRLKPYLKSAIINAKLTGNFEAKNPYKGLSEMYKFFESQEIHEAIF